MGETLTWDRDPTDYMVSCPVCQAVLLNDVGLIVNHLRRAHEMTEADALTLTGE